MRAFLKKARFFYGVFSIKYLVVRPIASFQICSFEVYIKVKLPITIH